MSDAYDMIDRFLRNNLGDDDYADFSAALDSLCVATPQQAEAVPKDHPLYVFATEVIHGAYRYTELPAKAKAAIAAQGEKS